MLDDTVQPDPAPHRTRLPVPGRCSSGDGPWWTEGTPQRWRCRRECRIPRDDYPVAIMGHRPRPAFPPRVSSSYAYKVPGGTRCIQPGAVARDSTTERLSVAVAVGSSRTGTSGRPRSPRSWSQADRGLRSYQVCRTRVFEAADDDATSGLTGHRPWSAAVRRPGGR